MMPIKDRENPDDCKRACILRAKGQAVSGIIKRVASIQVSNHAAHDQEEEP